jgi:hypothetical protein
MDIIERETIVVARRRLRWGPIWGGLFVVAAVQILMQLFAVAVGLSVLHARPGAVQGVSIWADCWTVIGTCAAFFSGGWFAGGAEERRLHRADAVRSGALVWGFALTLAIFVANAGLLGAVDLARALLHPGIPARLHPSFTLAAAWVGLGTILVALGCSIAGALLGAVVVPLRRVRDTRLRAPAPPLIATPTTTPA